MAQQVSITTLNRWAKYAKDVADYMGNQLSVGDTIPTEINDFLKNSGFDQARKQEIKDDPYYFNNIKKVAEAVNGNNVNSLGNTGPKSSMGTSFGGGGGATVTGTVKEKKLDPALLKLQDLARLKKNSKGVKHFYSLPAPADLNFVLHRATSDPILLTGSLSENVVPTWDGQTAEEIRNELDEAYGSREKWLGTAEWDENLAKTEEDAPIVLSEPTVVIDKRPYTQKHEDDINPVVDVSLFLDPKAKSTRDLIKGMDDDRYDELKSKEMTKYIDLRWIDGHAFSKLSEEEFDDKVRVAIAQLDSVRQMVSGSGSLVVVSETINQVIHKVKEPTEAEPLPVDLMSSAQKEQDTAMEKVFSPTGQYEEADENGEYYSDKVVQKVFNPTGEYKEANENGVKAIEKVSVSVDQIDGEDVLEVVHTKPQAQSEDNVVSISSDLNDPQIISMIVSLTDDGYSKFYDNEMDKLITFGAFNDYNDPAGRFLTEDEFDVFLWQKLAMVDQVRDGSITQANKKEVIPVDLTSSAQKEQDAAMEKVFSPTGEYEEADESGEYYSDKVAQKVFNPTGEYKEVDENDEKAIEKVSVSVDSVVVKEIFEDEDPKKQWRAHFAAMSMEMFESIDAGTLDKKYGQHAINAYSNRWEMVFNNMTQDEFTSLDPKQYSQEKYGFYAIDAYLERKLIPNSVVPKPLKEKETMVVKGILATENISKIEQSQGNILPISADLKNPQVKSMILSMTKDEYSDFYDNEMDILITIGVSHDYKDPKGKYSNSNEHDEYLFGVLAELEEVRKGPVLTHEQKLIALNSWIENTADTSGFGKMSEDEYGTWWKALYDKFVVKFIDEDTPDAVDSEMSRRIQVFQQQWEDAVKAQPELDMKELLAKANKNQNIQMPEETMDDFKAKIENIEIDNQKKLAVQQENDASLMQALIKAKRGSKIAKVFKKPTVLATNTSSDTDKAQISAKPETDISKAIEAVADVIPEGVKDKLSEAGVYFTKGDFSKDYNDTKSQAKEAATTLLSGVSGWLSGDSDKKEASAKSITASLEPKPKTTKTRRGRRKSSAKAAITAVKPKTKTVQTRRGRRKRR